MTLKLNGIVLAAADTTVLSYIVKTNPNPLQISSTGSITVVVYNNGNSLVSCSSLTFTISKGIYDTDLTNDPSSITSSCPQYWSGTADGSGRFVFTPTPGHDMIGPDGLSFVFNSIAVNDQVGGTPLYIKETVTQGGSPKTNTTSFTLSKFPQNFALQYFNVNPTSVSPGGSVTVSWSGSANSQNVTYDYSLSYNTTTIPNLPNVDSYLVENLLETTFFTLNITANGSAQYQQQLTVSVAQPEVGSFGIVGNPTQVPIGSSFQLYWQTVNAAHCTLSLNGAPIGLNLPANMDASPGYPVTAPTTPGTYSYALTAIGSDGSGPNRALQVLVYEPPVQISKFGIVGNPIEAVAGSTIQLYWSTQGATQCELVFNGTTVASNLPTNIDPSQGYAVTLPDTPGAASFVLSAYYNQVPVSSSNLSVSVFRFQFVTAINIPSNSQISVQMLTSPDGSQVYLLDAGGSLTVINTATYTPSSDPINVASGSLQSGLCSTLMSLSSDGSYLYVACGPTDGGAQVINVIDTLTWHIQSIPISVEPAGSVICGVAMSRPPSNYLVVSSAMITPTLYNGPSTLYVLEPSNNYNVAVKIEAGNNVFFSGLATATQSSGVDVFCIGASMESSGTPSTPCVYSFEIKGAALNPVNLPDDFGDIGIYEMFITSPGYAANYASFASLLDPLTPQFFNADMTILSTTCSVDGKYLYYGGVYLPTDYGNGARIARIPTNAPGHFTTLYTYDDMPPGEEILVNVNAIIVSPDGKYLYAAVDTITPTGGSDSNTTTQVLVFNFP